MRRYLLTSLAAVLLLALAAGPVFGAGEKIRLSNGKLLNVMHPGEDGVSEPRVFQTRMIAPDYPHQARGVQGDSTVTLAVLVTRKGRVAEAFPVDSDHPGRGFEEAAMRAIGQWRFRPARHGKEKVDSYTFVRLTFHEPQTRALRSGAAGAFAGVSSGGVFTSGGSTARVGSAAVGASRAGRPTRETIPRGSPGDLWDRAQGKNMSQGGGGGD
jgi:TonB family protein